MIDGNGVFAVIVALIFFNQMTVARFDQIFHIRVPDVQLQIQHREAEIVIVELRVSHIGISVGVCVQDRVSVIKGVWAILGGKQRLPEFRRDAPRGRLPFVKNVPHRSVLREHIPLTLCNLAAFVAVEAPHKELVPVGEKHAEIQRALALHLLLNVIRHRREAVHESLLSFVSHAVTSPSDYPGRFRAASSARASPVRSR